MTNNPFCGNTLALPYETIAEISDGVTLGIDALDGKRLSRRQIDEAAGHLRFAQCRIHDLITQANGGA